MNQTRVKSAARGHSQADDFKLSERVTLVLSEPLPLTAHPAAVYLRSLAPGSKPTMTTALNTISRSEALRDRFSVE